MTAHKAITEALRAGDADYHTLTRTLDYAEGDVITALANMLRRGEVESKDGRFHLTGVSA